jgi:hypothetical protein
MDTKRSGRAPRLLMPAVQQRRDFVEKEGVEVAHMGEALAGQDYSEQWASPAFMDNRDYSLKGLGDNELHSRH